MESDAFQVRPAADAEFPLLAGMAAEDPGVVAYTAYTYWMLRAMAEDAVLVVPQADGLAGYALGVYLFHPGDAALLLQMVVRADRRRSGIGSVLVADFARRAAERGCKRVLLTIDERNQASERFFHGVAGQRGWGLALVGGTGTLGGLLDPERMWELDLAPGHGGS